MRRLGFIVFAVFICSGLFGCTTHKMVAIERDTTKVAVIESDTTDPNVSGTLSRTQVNEVAAWKHIKNGRKHLDRGQYKQAVHDFELALQKDHKSWEAHYYLGLTYQRWKRHFDAVRYYRLALGLNSSDQIWCSKVRVYVGTSLEYLGKYWDAEKEYQLAMTLDPGNKEASSKWRKISNRNKSKEKERFKGGY